MVVRKKMVIMNIDALIKNLFDINVSLNLGRHVVKEMLEKAGKFENLVDIGAGDGHDILTGRSINKDAEYYAVENYPPKVLILKKNNIKVLQINIENEKIPLENGSIDIVIANQVIEHAKEIFWIFHEISRILKKNGHLIIGLPNLAALHNRILLLFGRQPRCIQNNSAHVRGFASPDLFEFLNSVFPYGYSLKLYRGSNFYPFSPAISKTLAKWFPSLAVTSFFLFTKQKDYRDEFLQYPATKRLATNFYVGNE